MIQLLAAAPLLALLAQATPAAASVPYRVGPGDVIEVAVEGRPDLSRMPTVQTTGKVCLPRAGDVDVRGLTPPEIAARLSPLMAGDDLPAPRVAVRVADYHSQFVWVKGAVNRPGRKPLRAGTRLVDALLDAGGFLQGASGEVVVARAAGSFPDGTRTLRLLFSGREATPRATPRTTSSICCRWAPTSCSCSATSPPRPRGSRCPGKGPSAGASRPATGAASRACPPRTASSPSTRSRPYFGA